MTYYSVYDAQIKELRTDFAYYKDKTKLKADFEAHLLDIREICSKHINKIWNELEYRIIETPFDFVSEAEKHILREVIQGEYTHVKKGWNAEVRALAFEDIKRVVEFKEFGFIGSWYVLFLYNQTPLLIKHKTNDVNTYRMMYKFQSKLESKTYRLSIDSLKV
ncbi:hypothetical protein ACF91D_28605 [Staphylococcus sp. 231237_7MaSpsaltlick]|uniref:hypothetical protein n=1 Tax=Staphylococcus TaxID=1279 RepID=UPI003709D5EE